MLEPREHFDPRRQDLRGRREGGRGWGARHEAGSGPKRETHQRRRCPRHVWKPQNLEPAAHDWSEKKEKREGEKKEKRDEYRGIEP